MEKVLDNLIEKYVEMISASDSTPENKKIVAECMKETVVQELRIRIEDEIHDSMLKKVQKEMEEKRIQDQAQHLKALMIEGILLALIIGLVVNQFTDIITVIKVQQETTSFWWEVTLLICAALIISLIFYIGVRLYNSLVELMKKTT